MILIVGPLLVAVDIVGKLILDQVLVTVMNVIFVYCGPLKDSDPHKCGHLGGINTALVSRGHKR